MLQTVKKKRLQQTGNVPEVIRTPDLPLRSMASGFAQCLSDDFQCFLVVNRLTWRLVKLPKNPQNAAL